MIFIHFQNGKYNFIGQKGDTYPQQKPLNDNAISISMDAQMLLNGISRSLFATADDELRPVMNGVYFDIHTDDLTVKSPERASFILPKKPANLLKNLLAKESEQVLIKFDDNNAYITCTNFEMVCRLIEGRYPNYNSVIPQENPFKVTIDRISFLNALKRVSVFSNPASSLVKLHLKDSLITVSAQDIDFSTSAEERIVCQFDGTELSIGFKATYLIEGRYPNYNSVIPQNNPHKVTVDRQQLIGALRRVSIFSSQASSLIKLRMQENQIVISAQDIDFSTSAEETQVCQYAGAAMSIGFKSTFLIDILNNISADEVVIELADPSRAGVIVPVEQEENEDLLMLLMPMMLND